MARLQPQVAMDYEAAVAHDMCLLSDDRTADSGDRSPLSGGSRPVEFRLEIRLELATSYV